jgi:hypothetical protein
MNTKAVILLTSTALSLLAFVTYTEEMQLKEAIKFVEETAKAPDGEVDAKLVELLKIHVKAKKAAEVVQNDLIDTL